MCQDEFQVESDLISHVEANHQSQIEENLQKSYVKKQTRECKYCKLKFRLMSSLERHANDSNFIEPRRDRSHEYLNRKKRGVTEKTEEKVCCVYCGKVLKNKYHLKQHEFRAHAEDLPIACPFPGCEKRFAAKTVLRTHLRIHGEKKHVCDICGRSFLLMKGLIAHKYNHTDKKRYQCAHCPRSFTHKKIILIHIRSHFEEVIFRCNQCEKTYKWENDLKKHIQGAHLGDLPYKCKNCGKGYYCSSSRKYHQDRCQIPIFK